MDFLPASVLAFFLGGSLSLVADLEDLELFAAGWSSLLASSSTMKVSSLAFLLLDVEGADLEEEALDDAPLLPDALTEDLAVEDLIVLLF